jgi:hypothetical protein
VGGVWWWLSKHDGPFLNDFKIYFLSFRHNTNYKHTIKMAKGAWMAHLAQFRKAHPGMDPKKVFGEAAKTYKHKQLGGSALGGDLSPEHVHGMRSSGVDLDTQVATQYGGKKSRKSRKSRKSKSKSKKSKSKRSKSHKRRH